MKNLFAVLAVCTVLSCTQSAHDAKPRDPGAPTLFETAFTDGTRATEEGMEMVFSRKRIGDLKVTSGRIVACDPIVLFETEPFGAMFPTGAFPVELAIARIGDDERVAFARILFSEQPVVRWERAVPRGKDPAGSKQAELNGYGVDSGTGAFMDESAVKVLQARCEKDRTFSDKLIVAMEKTYKHTRSWCLFELDGENAAMFSSGYGDGSYESYIGYDSRGSIARLLTDFYLVSWMEQ